MLHITLADGKVIKRLFAGYVASEADLGRFVDEVRKEVASHRGEPILVEMWEYASHIRIKARKSLPTEAEEMTATQEGG